MAYIGLVLSCISFLEKVIILFTCTCIISSLLPHPHNITPPPRIHLFIHPIRLLISPCLISLYVHTSPQPSFHPSARPSIHPSIYPYIHSSLHVIVLPSVRTHVRPSVLPSPVRSYVPLFVRLCLISSSVRPFICPYLHLSSIHTFSPSPLILLSFLSIPPF
jgi:hypothetical protein